MLMGRITVQIDNVDPDDVAALQRRAEGQGMSLSDYLRDLLHEEAAWLAAVTVTAGPGAPR